VDSIEIITQPSSKYDAAGNAGIVNIKLKKDKRFGTNGSVALGYGLVDLANMTVHFQPSQKKRPIYLAPTATGLTIRIVLSICTESNPILFLIQKQYF
jgi:hypothetical protein